MLKYVCVKYHDVCYILYNALVKKYMRKHVKMFIIVQSK